MAVGTSPYDAGGAGGLVTEQIRVLIADDEPALRGALADLLEHEDDLTLIGTAGDADEAIALANDERPDVALVDVSMPAGGGARAAREIARCSPDTRVIALSAFEDRPTVLEMLRAGAVGYLVKGTAGEEIVGSIQKVMAGGASLSTEVIAGIVSELTKQLRREDDEREQLDARRARDPAVRRRRGRLDGVPADRRPHDRRHGGTRSARALLHASAPATERVVRRGGVTGARRAAGADHR